MKIGIISDIHEDIVSLMKAMKKLECLKPDEIICLGDIVGFSVPHFSFFETRDASGCLSIVRSNCSIVTAGNHDLFAIGKIPEHTAGFTFGKNWYNLDFEERKRIGENKVWLYEEDELSALLNRKNRAYIATLPEIETAGFDGIKILLTHFIFPDPTGSREGFVRKPEDGKEHFKLMSDKSCTISFCGHAHIEGMLIANKDNYRIFGFEKKILTDEPTVVIGPCIAKGKKKNGFLLFDTKSKTIESIRI